MTHHRLRRKAGRPAGDARQARPARSPAWASTCSTPTSCTPSCERDHRDADSSHDFGKDIIPQVVQPRPRRRASLSRTAASRPRPTPSPYWRDVGTIDAFWAANLDLHADLPALDLYDRDWPIWTYQEQLPPAKFVFDDDDRRGMAVESIVSGGCIVSGARSARSVLFSSVRVNSLCPDLRGGVAARGARSAATRGSTRSSSTAAAASRRAW